MKQKPKRFILKNFLSLSAHQEQSTLYENSGHFVSNIRLAQTDILKLSYDWVMCYPS